MKGVKPRLSNINIIPPISSHFQATIRKISRINDGIKCMVKSRSCCPRVSPGANASAANKLINPIARMQMILGVQ
jgi:hypothetical protein